MQLTLEQILAYRPDVVEVEIKAWGGNVYMRPLSAGKVLAIQKLTDHDEVLYEIAVNSVVDENGKKRFSEEHREFLTSQTIPVFNDFVAGFAKANGIADESMEELKKTLEETPSDEHVTEFLS